MEIILDDTGYISAQPPNKTLRLQNPESQANFELGVSMLIHQWDTLSTAVDNNWGGPQSAEKRDWITGIVIDIFNESDELDIISIHELLFNAMEDEFDVLVQDDSTVVVSTRIMKMYGDCVNGEYTEVKGLYQKWLTKEEYKVRNGVKKSVVTVEEDPNNPDDDSDSESDEDMDGDVDMSEDKVQQVSRSKPEPVVDDDGFTMVTKKGRR